MCGVLGLLLADKKAPACIELYEGLYSLQHRGQSSAGIITCGPKGRLYQHKGNGTVAEVFREAHLENLIGNMGLGHLRYPTAGSCANSEAQPFYVNSPYGITFAHNGNIINAPQLRHYLDAEAYRHLNTDSDSELLINIFAAELQKVRKFRINSDDIFEAVKAIYRMAKGSFACVIMIAGYGIIALRDSHGIRPLVIGERLNKNGTIDYCFSSESCLFNQNGFKTFRDVSPGEAIIIHKGELNGSKNQNLTMLSRQVHPKLDLSPDIFEFVYFARPDSVIDGISVYSSRVNMGKFLAKRIKQVLGPDYKSKVDVVISVPDSSRTSALEVAQQLDISFKEGFIKNRYIGRTFIMPGAQIRKRSVRRKLNVQPQEFEGKNVLIVDDSIVRGTTSKEIVQMALEAGSKKVYLASCAPPIRYPHIYGIDLAKRADLVAYDIDENTISEIIGADCTIFQKLEDLIESCRLANPLITNFEIGLFTGNYVTGVDEGILYHLELAREKNENVRNGFIKPGEDETDAPEDIALANSL